MSARAAARAAGLDRPGVAAAGRLYVGVGGWSYEPWRTTFYPQEVSKARELAYASRRLTAIEINSTYYGSQKPATFAKWRDETPDGFVFSVKATRYATQRRNLAEAGDSVQRFVASGIAELGAKLGPIVWQLAPTKKFDPTDLGGFLALLPQQIEGLPLRHAIDARHPSFMVPDYMALLRQHGCAAVFADSDEYPSFADLGRDDLVYARLMRTRSELPHGLEPVELDAWAKRARRWQAGAEPDDLPRVEPLAAKRAGAEPSRARDVFLFFISGAKERAPAAAMGLIERLGSGPA